MHKHGIKQFWQGKGFYIALAVVILGSALASWLAISAMMQRLGTQEAPQQSGIDGQEDIPWTEPFADAEQKQSDVPKQSASSSAAQSSSASGASSSAQQQQSDEPATWQTARTGLFVWPVQGNISQAFSGDELVFNETMQDWRTHNGVDLAAESGSAVKAPAAAEVTAVAQDGLWGGVVELKAGETMVRICGLTGISVKQGDTVKQGQELGRVGEVAAETKLGAHVHLEVLENGAYTDPQERFAD